MSRFARVPPITSTFWVLKVLATTLGETAGDLLSTTLGAGYAWSSVVLLAAFAATLVAELRSRRHHPSLYWLVILTTSTSGTTMADLLSRTAGVGYAWASAVLGLALGGVLLAWRWREGTLALAGIETRRQEAFFWLSILVSNTLGTSLGDLLSDQPGLGFLGAGCIVGAALAVVALVHRLTVGHSTALVWLAVVLTRPLGATLGDLLTKTREIGGVGLGTVASSALLAAAMLVLVITTTRPARRPG